MVCLEMTAISFYSYSIGLCCISWNCIITVTNVTWISKSDGSEFTCVQIVGARTADLWGPEPHPWASMTRAS